MNHASSPLGIPADSIRSQPALASITNLARKGLSGFDPKLYPMKMIKEKALKRHPLLGRWGDEIRGRVMDYGDLMFIESEVIIGAMLTLMREHACPVCPSMTA